MSALAVLLDEAHKRRKPRVHVTQDAVTARNGVEGRARYRTG
jgi:hypothetical protein